MRNRCRSGNTIPPPVLYGHMRGPGVGVFETMRVRRGAIPLLSRHLARLGRSLSALGLPAADRDLDAFVVPFTEMDEAVLRLDVRDGRAAVTVGGVPGGGSPVVITAGGGHPAPSPQSTGAGRV